MGTVELCSRRVLKKIMEDAVRVMGSLMASDAHVNILCLNLMFRNWKKSFRFAKKDAKVLEGDLGEGKEKASEEFEVDDRALLYTESARSDSCDLRRRGIFPALVSKTWIYSGR